MEGCPLSKCGSRLSAAHIRLRNLQWFHGWRAVRFHTVALALAPRTCVSKVGWRAIPFQNVFLALARR
eukprot:7337521-Pyramimonas_sp.AAC.1